MTVFLGGGLPTAAVEPIGAAEYVTTDDVHVLASYEEGAVNYTTVTLDKASLDAAFLPNPKAVRKPVILLSAKESSANA